MSATNGYLVISLDFELFWGLFDVKTISSYEKNLRNVEKVIPRLMDLADAYNVKLSFAAIGFLFAKNKSELLNALPILKPTYKNPIFDPYKLIEGIGNSEEDDPFHYADSLIHLIASNGNHEIGTHTFSHFYVNEDGQTLEQFDNDIEAAITIAKKKNITMKSIVFPRNQINKDYLSICEKYGITCYRGIEKHWMFNTYDTKMLEKPFYKAFRLMDAYINLSGYNSYSPESIRTDEGLINIPSSKFFRPYIKELKFLESRRIARINKGLTYAAKNKEIYHMWWHPHNFGDNIEENFKNLEAIFKHYKFLQNTYNYKSESMAGLAENLKNS